MYIRFVLKSAIIATAAIRSTFALPTISQVGSKFFTSDGNQFYIKGIAYQLTDGDPLLDTNQCQLDAALMKDLGANAIRVYHVEAGQSHDGCMSAFSEAGIYLFVDLDTVNYYIIQLMAPPRLLTSKPRLAMSRLIEILRDTEQFQLATQQVSRRPGNSLFYILIVIADIPEHRPFLQDFLACGGNASDTVDFFSLNAYEWCGVSSYDLSGYSQLEKNATNYPLPIFFSETGCITVPPRTFADQSAIFGSDMANTWSGAIVYEWVEVANNYGIVSYGAPSVVGAATSYVVSGTPTPVSPDYQNLKSQWATLSPTGVSLSAYSPSASSLSTPACPTSTANGWLVIGNAALPSIGQTGAATSTAPLASGTAPVPASGTAASSSPSATKSTANEGKEVVGMTIALAIVMLSFIVWL
ncbi:hypothetical protein MMC13_002393 [Lambiella insularis]|nr:hypothetical protein [Lambiella insularis]